MYNSSDEGINRVSKGEGDKNQISVRVPGTAVIVIITLMGETIRVELDSLSLIEHTWTQTGICLLQCHLNSISINEVCTLGFG